MTKKKTRLLPGIVDYAGSCALDDIKAEAGTFDEFYAIGGYVYPLFVEPRCKVCKHPLRTQIDNWLWDHEPRSVIRERVSEEISYGSLQSHWPAHGPNDLISREAALIAHAKEQGIDLDEHVGRFIDVLGAAKTMVHLGLTAVLDGAIAPQTWGEVVQSIALLDKVQGEGEGQEMLIAQQRLALMRVVRAIQKVAPPDVLEAISVEVQDDMVLDAISRQEKGRETEESKALLAGELTMTE